MSAPFTPSPTRRALGWVLRLRGRIVHALRAPPEPQSQPTGVRWG